MKDKRHGTTDKEERGEEEEAEERKDETRVIRQWSERERDTDRLSDGGQDEAV